MSWKRSGVALLALAASLLAVLAIAVFQGYIPASMVSNLTATQLGTFAAIAAVAAGAIYVTEE